MRRAVRYWSNSEGALDDITVEELQLQRRGAAQCCGTTLTARQLTPLLNLALRVAGDYNSVTIRRLQRRIWEAEIKLTGNEIRIVLDLALKAKNAENRRHRAHLKVVPSSDK
jgi:hypothetical protein